MCSWCVLLLSEFGVSGSVRLDSKLQAPEWQTKYGHKMQVALHNCAGLQGSEAIDVTSVRAGSVIVDYATTPMTKSRAGQVRKNLDDAIASGLLAKMMEDEGMEQCDVKHEHVPEVHKVTPVTAEDKQI